MKKLLKFEHLLFFVVLLFSLLFRVTNLDLIEFKTDEAVNLILASKFTPGGTVSSIGILNPPFFNYLLNPIAWFTLDPKVFSFTIALVNAISIGFFYLITRRYYGQTVAFVSSILFALSPWAILYSRKIWTQDLLVPFFILMFFSFHKITVDKKKSFWILFVLSSLFLIQLHQISILFVVLVFLFMLIKGYRPKLKYVLIGLTLGIIPLIPYLNYEIRNNYPDLKALASSKNRLGASRSFSHFLRPLQITGQGNFSFVLGQDLETFANRYPLSYNLRKLFYFEYILIILGGIIFFKKYKNSRIFVYGVTLLPFLYFFLRVDPFMHYYIIILPLLLLFLGTAFEFLLNTTKLLKTFSLILLAALIANSLLFNFSFFKLLGDKGYFKGDYGDTLKISQTHIKHKIYDELFLFQFVPLNYSFGYNPFAKMLYSVNSTQIPVLEKKFEQSNDPRINHELLAFYTKEPPTLESLDILRKKTKENSIYSTIYKVTLEDYLAKNYKKEYVSEKLNLRFFYPEHWKILENEDGIKVIGDALILIIRKSEVLPYSTQIIRKGTNENTFKGEKSAAEEILRSIRFLSD